MHKFFRKLSMMLHRKDVRRGILVCLGVLGVSIVNPTALVFLGKVPVLFGTSQAFAGVGTKFKRGDGASNEQFTAIAEVNSISGPNMSKGTIDVTSLDSTGGYKEFIGGFRDGGEVQLEMNFTLDGYVDMKTDFEENSLSHNYQIVLSDPGATTLEFAAFVQTLTIDVPTDNKVTAKVTLKVNGQVTVET